MFAIKTKTTTFLIGLLLLSFSSPAQKGLEKIIVEKYYVSDSKDAALKNNQLPDGSITYRIFVDMKPGYRFQAAYGIPGHPMKMATTTSFYNNEQYGDMVGNEVNWRNFNKGTVMLDSYLSVGAASTAHFGIPKQKDNEDKTVINDDGLLQNENPAAGIPIKKRDGLMAAAAQLAVTFYGLDSAALNIFKYQDKENKGQAFSTDNGSWAAMTGATGPDSANQVLIAQITTDGEFSFELNIQIGTPDGAVENYVAKKPVENEIQFPGLTFHSTENNPDQVKIKNSSPGTKSN